MSTVGFVENAVSDASSDPFLFLLTLTHPDLPAPMRFVRNTVDIISRGNTFTAFPFDIALPGASDGAPQPAQLAIDNVDQTIVQTLRALPPDSPPSGLIELVMASTPNTVEESLPIFKFYSASGDRFTVELELNSTLVDENEPAVQWTLTPAIAPALHN